MCLLLWHVIGGESDSLTYDTVKKYAKMSFAASMTVGLQCVCVRASHVIGGESDSLIYDMVEKYKVRANEWSLSVGMTVSVC